MISVRLGRFVFPLPSLPGFLLWELVQFRGRRNHWESPDSAFPIRWGNETPILRQNEMAAKCGLCAVLGLAAYSAGMRLFPFTSLDDLVSWINVLNRHILSLVPLTACPIALSLSSKTMLREPMGAMPGTGGCPDRSTQ